MKRINKILLAILILLIIFAGVMTFTHLKTQQDNVFLEDNATIVGSNSNGTVYKMEFGNNSSTDTAIIILGVHSLENGIHNATYDVIKNLTDNDSLNRKYIVYFIKLNFEDSGMNTSDYDTNRHMGELLANKYILPDIENYNPYVIVDVHEMEVYYDLQRYVGVIENKTSTTLDYANIIGNYVGYPVYKVNSGTSPKWVTIPLHEKGYNVILFETAQADTQNNKTLTAIDLVRSIDSLPIY